MLNLNNQPYTPPLSPGSYSPTFSPQRDMSPQTGCTTPPHEQLTYQQIKGQIVNKVTKNKEWSIAIQTLIKKSSEMNAYHEIQAVIDEIKGRLIELMKHHYGNYFSKTLVQVCTMQQKYIILQEVNVFKLKTIKQFNNLPNNIKIKDMFADISQDPQGTHAIQSLVEMIKIENEKEQQLIMQSVVNHIVPMSLVINLFKIKFQIHCMKEEIWQNQRIKQKFYKRIFDYFQRRFIFQKTLKLQNKLH